MYSCQLQWTASHIASNRADSVRYFGSSLYSGPLKRGFAYCSAYSGDVREIEELLRDTISTTLQGVQTL
jgi:hypothetical protein